MTDQNRPRERADTWRPWSPAGRRPGLAWPVGLNRFADATAYRLRELAVADVAPGRLVPWLAVAFGFGIVLYFAAEREPSLWAGGAALVVASIATVLTRHRPVAFPRRAGPGHGGSRFRDRDRQAADHRTP